MVQRRAFLVFLIVASFLASGCAASLFKVKPASELPPLSTNAKNADAGGVTIRVAPFLSDEESQELFEANLPLSGILPIRVELSYESGVPIETKGARFRLRDDQGREWKWLSPKQAISRILKANEITAYNPSSRKEFEKEFRAYAPVASQQKLTLTVEHLPQTATIALN